MARRRLDPDRALEITLTTTARRLARGGTERAAGVTELRALAGGRADVLAEACGMALGGFLAQSSAAHPEDLQAAAFLLEAGADLRLVVAHADATRDHAARGHHSTATTGGPPNGGVRPDRMSRFWDLIAVGSRPCLSGTT